jgi:protein-S-isoprenylcysteine O-methyltransferase Ste14
MTGTIGTILLGYHSAIPVGRAVASGAMMVCAVALYEWTRHTIKDRRFHIAWSGQVPAAVCEEGPYRYVRHPAYASYVLAFAAIPVALPGWIGLAIFLFNAGLFAHAARDDERSMAASTLAAEYARYKARVGMFVPRLRKTAAR